MTLTAYLVDDEPLALDRLSRLLEATGRVRVVGRATEPEDAVAALSAAPPDVCFLDIHLPRLSGFEVLARLPVQPVVVFTTAHAEHALEAFEVSSVDYLLKPVEPAKLARALDRVERLRAPGGPTLPDLRALLRELAAAPPAPRGYPTRIASRLGERLRFLDLPEVTHFVADDRLTFAVSGGKRYCVDESIAELERRLDPRGFVRIHRSTLVNVAWIREVAGPPGGLVVRLKDGVELAVARDRTREFKERMRG